MDAKTAIECVNYILLHYKFRKQRLNELEEEIIQGCWLGKSYQEIARESKQTDHKGYISNRASELWQQLSDALGENIKRNCLKTAISFWYQNHGKEILENRKFPVINNQDFSNLLQEKIYIHREEEEICYNALLRPKSCLRLKGLTQVGKTLMIQRVIAHLKQKKNFYYVYVTLKECENYHFNDTEKLMRWFAQKVTKQLNLNYQIEQYFSQEILGPIVQCTNYFEEYLLPHLPFPLVLCVDDVHLLLPHEEVRDSFFRMLRSWLEKEDSVWRQIFRLTIIYTTDIYTSASINRSPLNIGNVVDVSDFKFQEVEALVKTYKTLKPSQFDQQGITPLTELVNNNPYLLKIALDHLSLYQDETLPEIIENAATDIGIYKTHLRDLWLKLSENSALESIFKEVVMPNQRVALSPKNSHFLQRMGLIKIFPDGVEPRCELYRKYFAHYWCN